MKSADTRVLLVLFTWFGLLAISCNGQSNAVVDNLVQPLQAQQPQPSMYANQAPLYNQQQQQAPMYVDQYQGAQYPYQPQAQVQVPPASVAVEEEKTYTNIFDNLWNVAQSSFQSISDHQRQSSPDGQSDLSSAMDLFLDTTGQLGEEVVGYDADNAENKGTIGGVVGFFDNLANAGSKQIGRTAEKALVDVTGDTWVQEKLAEGVTSMFGVDNTAAQEIDLQEGEVGVGVSFQEEGACEVEWNANYMGELLNNGHETILQSEGECCEFCSSIPECNTWVYCGNPSGCGTPYYKYGECYLKHQVRVMLHLCVFSL